MPSGAANKPVLGRPWLVLLLLAGVLAVWWSVRPPEDSPPPPNTPIGSGPTAESAEPRTNAGSAGRSDPGEPADENETRDLGRDERRGGHTLQRHVGRTDGDLMRRLEDEPGISAASSFTNRAAAERTVARTLARNRERISAWIARGERRPNLALNYRGSRDDVIGRTLVRRRRAAEPSTGAVVVLRADGSDYFVLTSYPERTR